MFALALVLSRFAATARGVAAGFLRAAITPVKPGPVATAAVETNGAMVNQGGLVTLFNALSNNAAPAFGNTGIGFYAGTTNTWSAADMVGGFIRRMSTQSAADLTDTAANIIGAIPGAVVNQTFPLLIANLSSGTITPAGGTGVTLVGTTTIDRFSVGLFVGKVTGSAAVTLTKCFQFGGTGTDGARP